MPASSNSGEDEGWVLSYVYDSATDGSELLVLDAHNWGAAPVARVRLPRRVPYGAASGTGRAGSAPST